MAITLAENTNEINSSKPEIWLVSILFQIKYYNKNKHLAALKLWEDYFFKYENKIKEVIKWLF